MGGNGLGLGLGGPRLGLGSLPTATQSYLHPKFRCLLLAEQSTYFGVAILQCSPHISNQFEETESGAKYAIRLRLSETTAMSSILAKNPVKPIGPSATLAQSRFHNFGIVLHPQHRISQRRIDNFSAYHRYPIHGNTQPLPSPAR